MASHHPDHLLTAVIPRTPEGADHLLDLRELLMTRGHPGKCVRCFFALLGDLHAPGALRPLRHWLEKNIEVSVSIEGRVVESLRFQLQPSESLEDYCQRTIRMVREDRSYRDPAITLGFRYRDTAVAA